jgi:hypothetical protein
MIKKIFKQDSLLLGLITGIIAPWVLFAVLYYLFEWIGMLFLHIPYFLRTSTIELLSIVVNVFAMRYYMVKLRFEKTGKGFLIITFIYILAFFAHEYLFT